MDRRIAVLGVGCRLEGSLVACDLWLQEVADDGVQSYVRAVQEIKQGKLVERPVCTIKRCPAVAPAAPLASRIAFHQIDADQGINRLKALRGMAILRETLKDREFLNE